MALHASQKPQSRLKIDSRKELSTFLKAMLPKFLEVVSPRESGLLDLLYQSDLLTDTDNESMSGKDVKTRKDQARKLWFHLNKLPPEDFKIKVFPQLLKDYPHIIPDGFLTLEVESDTTTAAAANDSDRQKECLRHDITSRIRPSSVADLLYLHDSCLSLEDYEDITSDESDSDIVWAKMLDLFSDHSNESAKLELLDPLRALLQKHKIRVPSDLSEVMAKGFPCVCSRADCTLPASPLMPLRKVRSWAKKSKFPQSPRSSGSSLSVRDAAGYNNRTAYACSDDSQSLGSDNTVPDFPTRSPQQHGRGELEPNQSPADPGMLPQEVAYSTGSLLQIPENYDSDACSVRMEESGNQTKSADLEGVIVEVPKSYHSQGQIAQSKTDEKPEVGDGTVVIKTSEEDEQNLKICCLRKFSLWDIPKMKLSTQKFLPCISLYGLVLFLMLMSMLAINQSQIALNHATLIAFVKSFGQRSIIIGPRHGNMTESSLMTNSSLGAQLPTR